MEDVFKIFTLLQGWNVLQNMHILPLIMFELYFPLVFHVDKELHMGKTFENFVDQSCDITFVLISKTAAVPKLNLESSILLLDELIINSTVGVLSANHVCPDGHCITTLVLLTTAGKATTDEELEEMLEGGNSAVFTAGVSHHRRDNTTRSELMNNT